MKREDIAKIFEGATEEQINAVIDGAISKSGAKNAKAVKALLDLDALKSSKNQADDITKALDEIKEDNDYMFTSDEPFKNPVRETNKPNKTKTVIDRFID